jgi:hypothetical protein
MKMISIGQLALFSFAVVGLTNIIVDPATILQPVRDAIEKSGAQWLNKLVSCYQCTGVWAGFLCGYLIVSHELPVVFLCGMAGSYLSTASATYMNYLEAKSIIDVENE